MREAILNFIIISGLILFASNLIDLYVWVVRILFPTNIHPSTYLEKEYPSEKDRNH